MEAVPKTMRAAAIDRFGPPEVLTIHELPVPTVGTNEVLIALHTAGVGSWDADIRDGWYPEGDPRFPLVLGTDGSGTMAAVGSQSGGVNRRGFIGCIRWSFFVCVGRMGREGCR